MSKHVRIKPYNPRKGCVLRKYTHVPTSKKFDESLGWYIVDDSVAAELVRVRQREGDEQSPMAFDIVDAKTAREIDAKEKKDAIARREAGAATDLSTQDLREGTDSPAMERMRARAAREAVNRKLDDKQARTRAAR